MTAVAELGDAARLVPWPARTERRDLGDRVLANMARAVELVSSAS